MQEGLQRLQDQVETLLQCKRTDQGRYGDLNLIAPVQVKAQEISVEDVMSQKKNRRQVFNLPMNIANKFYSGLSL